MSPKRITQNLPMFLILERHKKSGRETQLTN